MIGNFKEVTENFKNRFAESPLGKQLGGIKIIDNIEFTLDESLGNIEISDESHQKEDTSLKMKEHNPVRSSLNERIGEVPNYIHEEKEDTWKTDDNGDVYMVDGKLRPNAAYVLKGNIYKTDEYGRIKSCEAKPQRSPENPRDIDAQRRAGGENRRPNDQGGHIIGRDLNGDGGYGNLIAMDSRINQSDYKRMENDIKNALDEGKEVTTKTEMTYRGNSERPDRIKVTVTIDGKQTVYEFDNNLDGSLLDKVPENGKDVVLAELKDTGGQISSIKQECDENGNPIETTIYITYTDKDGTNHRTKVVIDN